jgi:hypothetical protein
MSINNHSQVRGNALVEAALRAIENAPPRIVSQARRNELSDQMSRAAELALGVARAPAASAAEGPAADPE